MLTLKEIKPGAPDYYKPIDELIEDLGNAKSGRTYGDVIITVEDLTDAIYYLKTYQDTIDKLASCQKENRRLKKRVEKLESDARLGRRQSARAGTGDVVMKCPFRKKIIHKPEIRNGYYPIYPQDVTEYMDCYENDCPFYEMGFCRRIKKAEEKHEDA